MKKNTDIYRMLVRTAGMARRMPANVDGDRERPKQWHGYGHILDTLSFDVGMSQQQIASAIGIRPQSISEALSVMEERGLVRREPSEQDKRVTLVYLTEHGAARRSELSAHREYKAEHFLCCLDDNEKDTLYSILKKLSDNCREEDEA